MNKYLYGYDSEENSYMVDGYPWGFRLRTQKRYWVESREGKGQRFCSQTMNPKTGMWCKPKKATYDTVTVMYLNDDGHVCCGGLGLHAETEMVNKFIEYHGDNLTRFQLEQCNMIIAGNEIMKHVTFEVRESPVGPVSLLSQKPEDIAKREALLAEQEDRNREQRRTMSRIGAAIELRTAQLNKSL